MWLGLISGSPGQVAGLVVAQTLPALVLGPLAGVLADRWNPHRTMIVCDLLRGALVFSLVFVPSASLLALGLVGLLSGLVAPWQVLFGCGVLLCSLALSTSTWKMIMKRMGKSQ